mgnify:CR=1 FL=1
MAAVNAEMDETAGVDDDSAADDVKGLITGVAEENDKTFQEEELKRFRLRV